MQNKLPLLLCRRRQWRRRVHRVEREQQAEEAEAAKRGMSRAIRMRMDNFQARGCRSRRPRLAQGPVQGRRIGQAARGMPKSWDSVSSSVVRAFGALAKLGSQGLLHSWSMSCVQMHCILGAYDSGTSS